MSCKGPRRPAKAGGAVQEWWAAHARWLEYTARSRSSSTSSIFGRRKRSHPVLRPNGVSQLAAIAKSVQAPGNVSRLRRVPPPLPPSPQFSDRDQGDRYSRSSTRHRCVKWQSSATHHCKGGGCCLGATHGLFPEYSKTSNRDGGACGAVDTNFSPLPREGPVPCIAVGIVDGDGLRLRFRHAGDDVRTHYRDEVWDGRRRRKRSLDQVAQAFRHQKIWGRVAGDGSTSWVTGRGGVPG